MISKLVRRNIAATKGRLILMLLSIVLGVSFVSGSFLLADSLRAVFGDVSEQIFAGVDVGIRGLETDLSSGEDDPLFDEAVFDQVATLPEVEYAEKGLFLFEQVYTIDDEGNENRPQGPPVFTGSWAGPSIASSYTLVDGRAPVGDEIAIDVLQAETEGYSLGDVVQVTGPGLDGPLDVTVAALISFGNAGGVSPYFNLFDLETSQRISGLPDRINFVSLNANDDVTASQLRSTVQDATGLRDDLEVVLGQTLIDDQNAEFDEFISIFGWILFGFAIVVLFVSTFIIYNTFAILIGQRIRQFGLLRSVGATGSQLTTMVMVEALIIGVLASIIGLFGGAGIATLLKWLFSQGGGGGFPDGPLVFKARTIIIVFILGIGVTLASAILPAITAQRIPALAALRDGAMAQTGSRRRRILIGSVILGLGVVLTLTGLFASLDTAPRLSSLGVGAALLFIGVAMMSVLFASRVTSIIGAPVRASRGLTGRLGSDNASRNPQRTAATASALMIGLALITGVLVLTQSLQASFNRILDETVAADLFVYDDNQGLPFAGSALDRLKATPEIADVAAVAEARAEVDGEVTDIAGFDTASGDRVLDIQLTEGTYDGGPNGVLLYRDASEDNGLTIGDAITVRFQDDAVDEFTITGIYDDNTLVASDWVFDRAVTASHADIDSVGFIGATFAAGVDPLVAQAAAEEAVSSFPQLVVQDNSEFKESQESQLNQLLIVVFGLLGLCIIVAFIGIVNTMALSILERTREIGLLRAVGTSRKQLRSAVRWEAIIVGVFGAFLGVVLGIIMGYAAVTAIPDSFISEVSIPWVWAIVFMFVGGLLGMLAAIFPARRAARMNVLDAISTI